MTGLVTLAEAKLFCRIDGIEEDAIIAMLIGAASAAVFEVADGWLPIVGDPVPDRIKLAVLVHVGRAYDDRYDGVDLPASAVRLLGPMRRLEI